MEREEKLTRRKFLKFSAAAAASFFLEGPPFEKRSPFEEVEESLQAGRLKTPEELRVESVVERAYRLYFREYVLGGKRVLLRIPFGQYAERFDGQNIFGGGKGEPEKLWVKIEELLKDESFAQYQEALSQPGRKLIHFNLPGRTYQMFFGEEQVGKLKVRLKGNELYPYEVKEDSQLSEIDIYNFLYCLGRVGVDCSGFSFYLQRYIGLEYGVDLCEEIGKRWRVPPERVPLYIGTWYYNPKCGNTERVDDKIINLRAGDLILFPARRWENSHSAVICSINLKAGAVRYVQDTDWVFDRKERGPHASAVYFDPSQPEKSLSDPSLTWTQELGPVFESETCPYGNETDRFRYLLPPYKGKVVRLKRMVEILSQKEPLYYTNFV